MLARLSVIAVVAALMGSLPEAMAQPVPAAPTTQTAASAPVADDAATRPDRRLRARVEERYRVVQTRDGLVFVPRQPIAGVHGVELVGDQLLIDGRAVSGAELRSRLGGDADVLLASSYLDDDARRALFAAGQVDRPVPAEPAADAGQDRRRAHRHGARVRIGSDLHVAEHERVGDVAVAVFGSVVIEGEVAGDVVAVAGSVRLGPRAVVRGDVTAVGGRIEASPTSQVLGESTEVALAWPRDWGTAGAGVRFRDWPDRAWWSGFALTATSIRLGVLGLLGLVAALLGGALYRRAGEEVSATPWQAMLVGLAAQLVLAPALLIVCGALLVSVIGIPVLALVPVALLVFGVLWIVGFAAVADRVGRRILRISADEDAGISSYVIGFVLLVVVVWVARLAWWTGTMSLGWAFALGLIGMAIEGLAWAAGLGALLLAWLRSARGLPVTRAPIPQTPMAGGPAGS